MTSPAPPVSYRESTVIAYTCHVPLRITTAVRYVNPLREGGSMPGLIEASDGNLYVVKMRGAGQGPLALVAEIIAGELARTLGLKIPDIVLVELDPSFGRQERDPEIRALLRASTGINMGLAFLGGSTTFDPAAGDTESSDTASLIVWLDAFVMNVDRTTRNPNLLRWLLETWLIDHGASLYFHHDWASAESKIASPFARIHDHVLLPWADDVEGASASAHQRINEAELKRIVDLVPADWLTFNNDVSAEDLARAIRAILDGAPGEIGSLRSGGTACPIEFLMNTRLCAWYPGSTAMSSSTPG